VAADPVTDHDAVTDPDPRGPTPPTGSTASVEESKHAVTRRAILRLTVGKVPGKAG
jgi:hypothetical protein